MKPASRYTILGGAALCSVLVGGLGSLVFMHLVGRHNDSTVLAALFTVWVSSPFVASAGLWFAIVRSPWLASAAYYSSILATSLVSVLVYGFSVLGTRTAKPAFPFLVTPLASWVVVAFLTASVLSRKRKHEGASPIVGSDA